MKILVLFFCIVFCGASSAQDSTSATIQKKHWFGARGGLSIVKASQGKTEKDFVAFARYNAFLVYALTYKHLYISPEIGITSKGYREMVKYTNAQGNRTQTDYYTYTTTAAAFYLNIGGYFKNFYPFASAGIDVIFDSKTNYGESTVGGVPIGTIKSNEPARIAAVIGLGIGYHVPAGKFKIPFQLRYDLTLDNYNYQCFHLSTGLLF